MRLLGGGTRDDLLVKMRQELEENGPEDKEHENKEQEK